MENFATTSLIYALLMIFLGLWVAEYLTLFSFLWGSLCSFTQEKVERKRLLGLLQKGERGSFEDLQNGYTHTKRTTYKFFTFLWEELLTYQHNYGKVPSFLWQEMRKYLLKDELQEKKIRQFYTGIQVQMISLTFLLYLFFISYKIIFKYPFSWSEILPLGLGQCAGFYLLHRLFFYCRKKIFQTMEHIFQFLICFTSFMQGGLNLTESLKKSHWEDLRGQQFNSPMAQELISSLELWIERIHLEGNGCLEEGEYFLSLLEGYFDEAFIKFQQYLAVIRLFLLFVFFLAPYFFYLFHLFFKKML
jgi:hypothetical protein